MKEKQLKFCNFYLMTFNAAKAARIAGYNPATAYRLLKQPEIKSYLAEKMEQAQNDTVASMKEVLSTATQILRDNNEKPQNRLQAANVLIKAHNIGNDTAEPVQIIITGEDKL